MIYESQEMKGWSRSKMGETSESVGMGTGDKWTSGFG